MIQPGMLKLKFQFVESSFVILWSLFVLSWITHEKCNQQWPFELEVWYNEGKTGKKQDFLNWAVPSPNGRLPKYRQSRFLFVLLKEAGLKYSCYKSKPATWVTFWNLIEHIRVSLWNTGVKNLYRSIEKWEYVSHELVARCKSLVWNALVTDCSSISTSVWVVYGYTMTRANQRILE